MLLCDEYLVPASLDEAFDAIARNAGRHRMVAGAADTLPLAREGRAGDVQVPVLIDVAKIPELRERHMDGRTTTPNFAKYILPTSLDVPRVTSVIVEDPDPIGPLGVKGIGEPAMIPTIPAVMNAVYDAIGVRITALPATPEKVLAAIKQKAARLEVAAE